MEGILEMVDNYLTARTNHIHRFDHSRIAPTLNSRCTGITDSLLSQGMSTLARTGSIKYISGLEMVNA